MYATVAADVDPSVAPPKIVAKVGCPVQNEHKCPCSSAISDRRGIRRANCLAGKCDHRTDQSASALGRTTKQFIQHDSLSVATSRCEHPARIPKWLSHRHHRRETPRGHRTSMRDVFVSASTARHFARMRPAVKQDSFSTIFCGRAPGVRRTDLFHAALARRNLPRQNTGEVTRGPLSCATNSA